LSKEDITEIGQTIALLRKRDHSEAPPPKILQMLNDCGASQTAGDIVEAQSIVYRGQAAALMAVGFLRYRDAIKALGHKLLFPELKANSDRTPFGECISWIGSRFQDAVIPNAEAEKKSFHSFRKTSANDLKGAGVPSELRADILGHGEKILQKNVTHHLQN
jgi:integrase